MPALLIGADARIRSANGPARDLFGDALDARHHGIVLRQPEILAAIAEVLRGGPGQQVRHTIAAPGHELVHEVTVSPVASGAGQGALCVFQDRTDSEQTGQMRRDFVANVSHELRTPLTSLLGFIETLRGAARDDPAARDRFLTIMAAEAERMNRLVRDLLHLSRVEAEERRPPTTRHDLAALIRSAVAALRPMAEARGVRFDLIGLDAPRPMLADADQITQLVTNLVENAVKYGGTDGVVTVRLHQTPGPRGDLVQIDITDQGDGIEAQHIPRLTERFYRIDGHRSRQQGGTGLGLAIVKHIAQRHRGRLRIDSEPGRGSTFSVVLPLT